MAMCEDYPCCGHTDGLGCDYTPDYDYIYKHVGCDHEAGYCQLDDVDEDEEEDGGDPDLYPAQHYVSEFGPQW